MPTLSKIALLSKRLHMHTAFRFSNTLVVRCNPDTVFPCYSFSVFQQQWQQLKKAAKGESALWLCLFVEHWERVSSDAHSSFKTILLVHKFSLRTDKSGIVF